jgi:hypothetical protein
MSILGVNVMAVQEKGDPRVEWEMRLSDPEDPRSRVAIKPDVFDDTLRLDEDEARLAQGIADANGEKVKVKAAGKAYTPEDGVLFLVAVAARYKAGTRMFYELVTT